MLFKVLRVVIKTKYSTQRAVGGAVISGGEIERLGLGKDSNGKRKLFILAFSVVITSQLSTTTQATRFLGEPKVLVHVAVQQEFLL